MCPEQMKVKVKIEGCGVLHKRCETENSFPLYKAETIFKESLTLKWNFVVQEMGVLFYVNSVMRLLL